MKILLTLVFLFIGTSILGHKDNRQIKSIQFYKFANDEVPTLNHYVDKKLTHSLKNYKYCNIGSYILQRKAVKMFPIIEPILKQYGIPDDFKYMPLVESGFDDGVSKAGAAGPWQLMPGIARLLGLKVRRGNDDRYNLHKSTVAACKYLRDLHNEFNDWTLVAAAYNDGDGKIRKALRTQQQHSYFLLKLNPETGSYVYKLVAMKQIIEYPTKYGYINSPIMGLDTLPRFGI